MKGEIITTIDFSVLNQKIVWPKERFVIAGSVGHVAVRCSFDSDWDGLSKRFIFTNGDISKSVLMTSTDEILIPHEVLTKGKLLISIVGQSENGEKKITTRKMVLPINVLESGAQVGGESEAYTPELWEQALIAIGDLTALDTAAKGNLVAAINELASKGFGGENGYTPVRGTDYWTEDDIAEIKGYVDEAILSGAW